MLDKLITSKTRLNLLIKFFINITNESYLNSLASEFGESTNSVRKELNNLYSAGYLVKKKIDNKVIYSANKNHPLFNILQSIIKKHLGIEKIVNDIVNRIGSIERLVVLGDYAVGIDSGCIDLLIIGKNINIDYLEILCPKIEKKIKRKINFMVSTKINSDKGLIIFDSK